MSRSTAKWDGGKLVITTKTDNGDQVQTWSLEGGNAHHRAHRRPWPLEDDLQEDHVVRSWTLEASSLEAGSVRFRPFFCRCLLRSNSCPQQLPHRQPCTPDPRDPPPTSASGPRTNKRGSKSRMRHRQTLLVHDVVAGEDQIQIEGPRARRDRAARRPKSRSMLEQRVQQLRARRARFRRRRRR